MIKNNPIPAMSPASKSDLAYFQLKRLIQTGELAPGQKLIYAELENRLQMSKTPIINGLYRLESEGYLRLKKNMGYFVQRADPENIVELMQAREVLELANLDIVIQNRAQADIEHLQAVCEEYARYSPEFFDRKKSALNTDFHLSLARMGKNPFLIRYLEHLYEWIDLRVMFNLLPPDRVRRTAVEHARILEALKGGRKATLKRALRQHLRGPTKVMLQRLQQMQRG